MNKYDAIVIGAGHNGLTNAAYLAKAGLNVVLLEKNDFIGGASCTQEFHEGWKYSSYSYVCSMMRQAIHRDLDLARHGLLIVPYLGTVNYGDQDERFFAYHDAEAAHAELKRHSPRDADAMHRFQADLTRYAQLIRKTLMRTPPDPTSFRPRDIKELLFFAKEFWSLGEKEIYEYVRFFTISAAEFLDDYFETDLIKATMAGSGIIGTALGVYSPGSSYILLHHVMGDVDGSIGAWGLPRGGMGAISESLAGAMRQYGGELRTNAPVKQVLVENRKAVGVVLENGDELMSTILSCRTWMRNRTFTRIIDKKDLALTASTRKRKISRCVARPERSILRCPVCRNSRLFRTTATSTAVDTSSQGLLKLWNALTIAGSMAAFPMTRLSKASFRQPGIRPSRRPANTGCPTSCSTARLNSIQGNGRRKIAINLARPSSTRLRATARDSKT